MKKIAAVFTGFNASLYSIIDNALRENLTEVNYELIVHANPNLISETLEAGYPTRDVVRGLLTAFVDSVTEGADVILSVCSTMGDIAKAAQPIFEKMNVPIVRIDERMMEYAVMKYKRIALVAACRTIMEPNKNLMEKSLQEMGSGTSVTYIIIDEMQGKPGAEASAIAIDELKKYAGEFDAVVMTQASMAPLTDHMSESLGIPVLSSSDFGAMEVAEILKELEEGGEK